MTNVILDPQLCNGLFTELTQNEHRVIWIRDSNYQRQLYLSPSYDTVWQRPRQILYESPSLWESYLTCDYTKEKAAFMQLVETKYQGEAAKPNVRHSFLYCITSPKERPIWIKDTHYFLFDKNRLVAVAGIAEAISEIQWHLEYNKRCELTNKMTDNFHNRIMKIINREMKFSVNTMPFQVEITKRDINKKIITLKDQRHVALSKREFECLRELANGHSYKEIASRLFISKRTVERHIDNIKNKFLCHKNVELLIKLSNPEELFYETS